MCECVILYVYHKTDERVVRSHYANLVRDNPRVPVVPLVYDAPSWIEGTVDVRDFETVWRTEREFAAAHGARGRDLRKRWLWHHCDTISWRYLRSSGRVEANRYVIFDWDTLSHGMSVEEFHEDVWDYDCLAGVDLVRYEERPKWVWWTQEVVESVGPAKARGIIPVSGMMLSYRVARLLAETTPPTFLRSVFCELYAPTLCLLNGIEVFGVKRRESMLHTYGGPCRLEDKPGIYHPVTTIPNFTRRRK